MPPSLTDCRFPPLVAPYDEALRQAVTFILERFEVLGNTASGTILRGNPSPSSDLDIYVVHTRPQRQRLQKFFNSVAAEIFVNPVQRIEGYFEEERKEARPITAHMLATGFVILDRDPVIEQLRERARKELELRPDPTPQQLQWMRYGIATQYEDAIDVAESDPATATMILGLAVHNMLQYRFWQANQFVPRDKDLLHALSELDPHLKTLAREFYESADYRRRLQVAQQISDQTIATHGFFEWDSPLEDV